MQTKYFPLQQLCGRLKSDTVTMNGCKLLPTATAKPSYCFRLVPLAYILQNPVFRDCRVQHCEIFFLFSPGCKCICCHCAVLVLGADQPNLERNSDDCESPLFCMSRASVSHLCGLNERSVCFCNRMSKTKKAGGVFAMY